MIVLRLPFSYRLADSQWQTRILAPVAIGVRNNRGNEKQKSVSENFSSLSVMPGVAATFSLADNWEVSPSVQIGMARDLDNNTSSWTTSTAVRHHGWWDFAAGRLTLGQRLRFAGQRNRDGGSNTGFLLLEQGADWDFATAWKFQNNPVRGGVFFLWQEYFNNLDINGIGPAKVNVDRIFQVGATIGLERPIELGWFEVQRIGLSVSRGNSYDGKEIKAISLSLGFPLTAD